MATDYLKSFTAGEKITAVETNDNNQYLLNQISTSAKEIKAYIEQEMEKFAGNFVQAGFVIGLPCDVIPVGYLKCDGSSLLRADSAEGMNDGYADLFKAIGTIYGAEDDYHFNLPDFQGKFLRGYGGNSASIGTLQTSGAPNITGNFSLGSVQGRDCSVRWANDVFAKQNEKSSNALHRTESATAATGITFDASRVSGIYQNDLTELRPDNYAVHWIIKY